MTINFRHTHSMKRSHLVKLTMIVLFSLSGLGIVGSSFFLRKAFSSTSQPELITDTTRYREIRHQLWSDNEQIKHFPNEIPPDAQNVRIAYSPGMMQGGGYFQARLKQPREKIQKLLAQYRTIAKHKYIGGNTNDHSNLPNGVPTTFFHTSDYKAESFPASYEILVLDAEDRGTPGFKWNHGNSYGVAIDSSSSEIVYWAERW